MKEVLFIYIYIFLKRKSQNLVTWDREVGDSVRKKGKGNFWVYFLGALKMKEVRAKTVL